MNHPIRDRFQNLFTYKSLQTAIKFFDDFNIIFYACVNSVDLTMFNGLDEATMPCRNCLLYYLFSEKNPPIFQYVSSKRNPINLRDFTEVVRKHSEYLWPTINAVWYYSFTPTTSPFLYALLSFLLHTIPGHIIDFLSMMTGKKPM